MMWTNDRLNREIRDSWLTVVEDSLRTNIQSPILNSWLDNSADILSNIERVASNILNTRPPSFREFLEHEHPNGHENVRIWGQLSQEIAQEIASAYQSPPSYIYGELREPFTFTEPSYSATYIVGSNKQYIFSDESICSEDALDLLLAQRGYKKYMRYKEYIPKVIEKFPEIDYFLDIIHSPIPNDGDFVYLRSIIPRKFIFTSYNINVLLNILIDYGYVQDPDIIRRRKNKNLELKKDLEKHFKKVK